jgi:hypothetical protein
MKNLTVFLSALVALLFSAAVQGQITPPYYNPANVNITGGAINGTVIGGTTAAAGGFTSLTTSGIIVSTVGNNSLLYNSTTATDGFQFGRIGNNSAVFDVGINGATANTYFTTGTAYASVLASPASQNLEIGFGSTKSASFSSTGLAVTGALSATGNASISGGGKLQVGGALFPGTFTVASSTSTAGFELGNDTANTIHAQIYDRNASTFRAFQINADSVTFRYGHTSTILTLTDTYALFNSDMRYDKTITAPGTTGAQTINKTTGRVNFAALATSLVVTNSLATANSICHVTKATNDATMRLGACVAAAGIITIYADVAPAAETAVNFTVTN